MKWYKGIIEVIDEPSFGGSYIQETGDACEEFNFTPIECDDGDFCFGFVETKSTNRVSKNQLHIERIEGGTKQDEFIDHVLVVWCAKRDNRSVIVGWYKDARVYREYENWEMDIDEDEPYKHDFIMEAFADDCVLLPANERSAYRWRAPRKLQNRSYGFGQANVWFANEESAKEYIETLAKNIYEYNGENWINEYPPSAEE